MSSIFSISSQSTILKEQLQRLSQLSISRGKNNSGVIFHNYQNGYQGETANTNITHLLPRITPNRLICGYTGISPNYGNGAFPIYYEGIYAITDSNILNKPSLLTEIKLVDNQLNDSELIAKWISQYISAFSDIETCINTLLSKIEGVISAIVLFPNLGKLIAFSNTSSLYLGVANQESVIASEHSFIEKLGFKNIQAITKPIILDIPKSDDLQPIKMDHQKNTVFNINKFNPAEKTLTNNLSLLEYHVHDIKRCTRCILPETMPFIEFDNEGVCNYCHNYKVMNAPKSKDELLKIVKPYRKTSGYDCVVPFSGGRDSCYALHLIVNELKLKPVTYTYDWGMVTDVGQRNISRMCSKLGVENILVAADVEKKRKNVSMNLKAWLKKPNLGMLNILTAGDKHFFQYVDDVKKDNDIRLNLWGVNPLEVTHFKTGFLGIEPNFALTGVYSRGIMKQLRYQSKRLKAMIQNPSYFNSSLVDTLSGEYYRSFTKKEDYYHMFDYWQWNEADLENVLDMYDWDRTIDSTCSWRIGDGVAGFYNYVYYTVAGFTEHDTFRSNQIREGQLTRDEALKLVQEENAPRFENLQWFCKVLEVDFNETIKIVNSIPKLYK